jgi:radical SAM protein (TIGR01212 family)
LRYFSLKNYLTGRFGGPVAKISLDAGLTCPNRDGSLSSRGCLFCDAKGAGTGAASQGLSITEQMEKGMARARRRADRFICYFQSFTNTYAPRDQLESIWNEALAFDDVVGLAVGTRPDCLPDDILDLLSGYVAHKEVWLELGLQSASDRTLNLINRGHSVDDFARAAEKAGKMGLKVLAHAILGLPGERKDDVHNTARFITDLGLDGVKIHSLYVVRGTGLADMYSRKAFTCLTQEEFVRLAVLFLENIPSDMVVHRLTGDPDPDTLLAPSWSRDKQGTLNLIRNRLDELDTWQGRELGACRPN